MAAGARPARQPAAALSRRVWTERQKKGRKEKGHAADLDLAPRPSPPQVLRTNLGPRGTLKMLVDGAGAVKLTKVRVGGA